MSTITFSRPAEEFERLCTNHLDLDTPPNGITLTSDLCRIAVNPAAFVTEDIAPTPTLDRAYENVPTWPDVRLGIGVSFLSIENWILWPAFPKAAAAITEARLRLTIDGIYQPGGTPGASFPATYNAYGVKALTHATPTNKADVLALPRTTATTSVAITGGNVISDVIDVDVTALVLEVLEQPGWVPGTHDLAIVLLSTATINFGYSECTPVELRVTGVGG